MINFNNFVFSEKPFNHFVCDNFLENNIFKELKSQIDMMFIDFENNEYGKTDVVERYDPGKERGIVKFFSGGNIKTNAKNHLIKASERYEGPLKKVLNTLSDPKVQIKLYRALVNKSFSEPITLKPLRVIPQEKKISLLEFIFFRNVYISFKLSAYSSNIGLYQHIDHPDKVTALLLYLGFSDGLDRSGLGTQIYKVKEEFKCWSKNAGYTLDYFEKDKLVMEKDIYPKPNRLFGFKKSRESWHAVDPIDLPQNVTRNTLQINIYRSRNYSWLLSSIIEVLRKIKNLVK